MAQTALSLADEHEINLIIDKVDGFRVVNPPSIPINHVQFLQSGNGDENQPVKDARECFATAGLHDVWSEIAEAQVSLTFLLKGDVTDDDLCKIFGSVVTIGSAAFNAAMSSAKKHIAYLEANCTSSEEGQWFSKWVSSQVEHDNFLTHLYTIGRYAKLLLIPANNEHPQMTAFKASEANRCNFIADTMKADHVARIDQEIDSLSDTSSVFEFGEYRGRTIDGTILNRRRASEIVHLQELKTQLADWPQSEFKRQNVPAEPTHEDQIPLLWKYRWQGPETKDAFWFSRITDETITLACAPLLRTFNFKQTMWSNGEATVIRQYYVARLQFLCKSAYDHLCAARLDNALLNKQPELAHVRGRLPENRSQFLEECRSFYEYYIANPDKYGPAPTLADIMVSQD